MMLSQDQIQKINTLSPNEWQENEQGIFTEPWGVPIYIKEPVVYCRYSTGGVSGGSCWDDSNPKTYYNDEPKDKMKVLDLILAELYPNISYLQYKEIEKLIHTNEEKEYYGNSTDFKVDYIILSELINLIQEFKTTL